MKTKNIIGPPIDFNNNMEAKENFLGSLNSIKTIAEMAQIRFKCFDNKELLLDRKKEKATLKELHLKQQKDYMECFRAQSKK